MAPQRRGESFELATSISSGKPPVDARSSGIALLLGRVPSSVQGSNPVKGEAGNSAQMYLEQEGEMYKLSRLIGYSGVEVTEEYLKDFTVRAARQQQEKISAVGALDLRNKGEKKTF